MRASAVDRAPTVSLVIVAYNAAHHLPACLDSLARIDYPADRHEVIVVDNGSSDKTRQLVRDRYPWVRLLPQERTLGFAEANNIGAAASSSECVAFVNADMHFASDWLREMVAAYDPSQSISCVSSLILDWDGRHVDFAGGIVNFVG